MGWRYDLAFLLVQSVCRCWDAAVDANFLKLELTERHWAARAKQIDWRRRLALRIHREAALDAMVAWGYWG